MTEREYTVVFLTVRNGECRNRAYRSGRMAEELDASSVIPLFRYP